MNIKIIVEECEHCGQTHEFNQWEINVFNQYHCSCCNDHDHEITLTCPVTENDIKLKEY